MPQNPLDQPRRKHHQDERDDDPGNREVLEVLDHQFLERS